MVKKISNAEMMIRKDIENLSTYRLAPTKEKIELDIKYAFWHELICEDTYHELLESVRERYLIVFDNFFN